MNQLKEFNYKLLNIILPCGYWLNKWKKSIGEKCEFCNETETIQHMLYSCPRVKEMWNSISFILKCNISWKNIVCGWPLYDNHSKILSYNFIITIVCCAIFRLNSKCKFNSEDYSAVPLNRDICKIYIYIFLQ